MNITIKSKDGLPFLHKVYEAYIDARIDTDWKIISLNEDDVATELTVEIDPLKIPTEYDGQVVKMIALEALRIKQVQYLMRYKPELQNIETYNSEQGIVPGEVISVALDAVESHYYVNLITILLTESLLKGRTVIDLNAFARFNLKDYNKDFESKLNEFIEIKEEIKNGELGLDMFLDNSREDFIGNPFLIIKALSQTMDLGEPIEDRESVDITLLGRNDGGFDVSAGEELISKDIMEDFTGYSFEIMDEDDSSDYTFAFENSMIIVLYALIFLKSEVIYVDDKYNQGLRDKVSTYLESAGVYPEYTPYIVNKK